MENVTQRTQVDVGTETALTLGQAALGFGAGLLVAKKLDERLRTRTALTLLSLGLLTAVPFFVNSVLKIVNRPGSRRSMARRLRSIREVADGELVEHWDGA